MRSVSGCNTTASCLISFRVVSAPLPGLGLIQDLVVVDQGGLHHTAADGSSPGSSSSCSWEPTSSAVTCLHPLLSLLHLLMMPSLALTQLLMWRSSLSGHIPSPPPSRATKKGGGLAANSTLAPISHGGAWKRAFLSGKNSLYIVCNGETIRVAQTLLVQGEGLTPLLSPERWDASELLSLSSSFPHWASPHCEMIVL